LSPLFVSFAAYFMPSSLFIPIERARERFRQDVADQLRMAAENAGLGATVTLHHQRAVLEFDATLSGGTPPRVIAAFDDVSDAQTADQVTVHVEATDEAITLLTLAWRDELGLNHEAALQQRLAELERRTDQNLPLERRGLNAPADVRTGRYAKGDVIRQLTADLKRAVYSQTPPPETQAHALVPIEPPPPIATKAPVRGEETPPPRDLALQRSNVSELLISSLMQTMQRDLAEAESHLVRPGVEASARGRVGRVMEWAMLATAYGVEANTNQIAVSSFLGGGAASCLYGLVGPVLIGGLVSLSRSKAGKAAAYGLMMTWALAMATITASEKSFLDHAQGFFPKQPALLTHEQAVATARLTKETADAELKRLNAPAKDASTLLADARRRWQAAEIKQAAEREAALRDKNRAQARQSLVDAGVALNQHELRLRDAMLNDPSRAWAWRTLFVIFGVINLAGPLAIARVLQQWRADHAEAEASAKDGHRKKFDAALLRASRSAQQAHAMLLLPALLHDLKRDGVPSEVIAQLDLGDISHKAAERFDRAVNGKRAARRLFSSWGPSTGPG
jgi:hypothetical protein